MWGYSQRIGWAQNCGYELLPVANPDFISGTFYSFTFYFSFSDPGALRFIPFNPIFNFTFSPRAFLFNISLSAFIISYLVSDRTIFFTSIPCYRTGIVKY